MLTCNYSNAVCIRSTISNVQTVINVSSLYCKGSEPPTMRQAYCTKLKPMKLSL